MLFKIDLRNRKQKMKQSMKSFKNLNKKLMQKKIE